MVTAGAAPAYCADEGSPAAGSGRHRDGGDPEVALFENTFPPYHAFGSRTLSSGMTGTDVAVLQTVYDEMLKVMNPPQGPMGQPITVTGTYDAATVQAVKNIQSYFGLGVDGVTGANTFFVFGQGVDGNITYGGPRYGSRTLSQGSEGGDVTILQNRLNLFRYSSAIGGPADGIYGPKTAAAVTQFQTDAASNGDTGLAADGVVGQATFNATWIYTYAGGRGIFTGRNGFDVVFLQVLLKKLGYYSGAIDGYYGSATQAAVVAFQRAAGISADGVVGQATYFALGQRNLVAAPLPMPIPPISGAPSESRCCVTMQPTSSALSPAVASVAIHNGPRSGSTVPAEALVSGHLGTPGSYGSQYTQFGVSLDGGTYQALTQCGSGTGIWEYLLATSSAGPYASNTFRIAPLAADGTAGPVILQGTANCPLPTVAATEAQA